MQAIITKILPATNTLGARIKADSWGKSIALSYDHALDCNDNHLAAAQSLVAKINDDGVKFSILASGILPNGDHTHIIK